MATVNQRLGNKIKSIRKSRGMSQEELAYQSKIDYSYINEIEAGKRNPSVKRVTEIARVLKVSIKELFDF